MPPCLAARAWPSLARSAPLALTGAALLLACSGRTDLRLPPAEAGADAGLPDSDGGRPPIEEASKVDVLLVVDNSKNLSAGQDLLARTVPYLLERLTRPACVNGLGNVLGESDGGACAVGELDFPPVRDMHVGVISTSLGGHGAAGPVNHGVRSTRITRTSTSTRRLLSGRKKALPFLPSNS